MNLVAYLDGCDMVSAYLHSDGDFVGFAISP